MKLHHWEQPPHLLCVLAHPDADEAKFKLPVLMHSNDRHPQVLALQVEPLASEARQWILSGERPCGDSPLAVFIAVLAIMFTCERLVGSLHSLVHRWYLYVRNWTLAYDSLELRMPKIVDHLEADPDNMTNFITFVYKCRTASKRLKFLGIKLHPAFTEPGCKTFMLNNVPYHGDMMSLYHMRVPSMFVRPVKLEDICAPSLVL